MCGARARGRGPRWLDWSTDLERRHHVSRSLHRHDLEVLVCKSVARHDAALVLDTIRVPCVPRLFRRTADRASELFRPPVRDARVHVPAVNQQLVFLHQLDVRRRYVARGFLVAHRVLWVAVHVQRLLNRLKTEPNVHRVLPAARKVVQRAAQRWVRAQRRGAPTDFDSALTQLCADRTVARRRVRLTECRGERIRIIGKRVAVAHVVDVVHVERAGKVLCLLEKLRARRGRRLEIRARRVSLSG